MKKSEIAKMDPIKAKYFKKAPILTRIKGNLLNLKKSFIKALKSKELKAFCGIVFEIGVLGLIIGTGMSLFGFPLTILTILSWGCVGWYVEYKLLNILTKLIGSLTLVRLSN